MRFRKTGFALALTALAVVPGLAQAKAPQCEVSRPVVFAGLDWASAAFHNALARFIVEKGYGCKTEDIPGSSIPLLNGMARGDIDITMEQWIGVLKEPWAKAKATGNIKSIGVIFDDAVQGWFVPRYVVEGPEAQAKGLKSVFDLPKYKVVFRDPEEPDKGRFYNGIAGWGGELVSTKKLHAYGLEGDYTNFRPGTGAALDAAISSAFKRKKPILFYYWGPTWVLGKYDVVKLDEPVYDEATWEKMGSTENPDKATAFPVMKIYTTINTDFAKQAPKLTTFFSRVQTSNDLVSKALVVMRETGGVSDAEVAAKAFLVEHPEMWTTWVPADVAIRVKAALK
ncbi:MAG: ABC transporter substrate-binding protein [Rhodospirillaceae bacterium]|nr:ABC transporter substrate-binding protein [Rhodospirillaceae bacterium]